MLLDGHVDVLAGGHGDNSTLQGVLVTLQPLGDVDHGRILSSQTLESYGRAAALLDLDHIAHAHQVGGDVDLVAIDSEMGVVHQLTGLTAGHGEAQTVHHVVQTALHQAQQVLAGLAGHGGSLLIVSMELLLQDAVDELDLLLLVELDGVLALLLSHLAAGVALGLLLGVTHDGRRNTQRLATLGDRLHILSHDLLILLLPITRDDAWGGGIRCGGWG